MQQSRGQGASQSPRGDQTPRGEDSATGSGLPETIGRYRLLSKIAKGGMAEVFAARSYGAHGFEKTVALKRILPRFGHDPQFVRMMVDEAKISVLLNHPNIAQIFELGEQDSDYFIVMEFVPGQSLSAVVKRLREENKRLEVLDACFLVVELLQGLHAAHTQLDSSGAPAHIIHRDVSPQNTLLSFDGHVKVIDFGIARARDRLEATEVGTIKGKLRYLAPEMIDPGRFTKEGDFDHRVDVFAAGIVLWELIAARPLFPGDEELKVYDEITDGKTPDLAKEGRCDQALMKIINTALERSLNKRYASAEAFADELRAYVYRSDPSFTHKRIATLLDKLFPVEKAQLLALERGTVNASTKPSPARTSSAVAAVDPSKPERRNDDGPLANAATARVDVKDLDPNNELQKDVAVVTLVSRQKLLVDRAAAPGSDGASGVFSRAEDATLTVGADDARQLRDNVGLRPQPPVITKTGPTMELPRRGQVVPATRDTILDDMPPTIVGSEPNRQRVVIASAFVGVALALAIVAGVDHFTSTPKPPATLVTTPVEPTPATAATTTAPATTTPPAVEPMPTGEPAAVPVQAVVMPSHASVTIDGAPVTTTTTVKAGADVKVVVSAPGFVTTETTVVAPDVGPLVITATLVPMIEPAPASGLPQTTTPTTTPTTTTTASTSTTTTTKPVETTKPKPKPEPTTTTPAAKGQGTLVIKTTPYWGKVTVDGRPEDDTTPLTLSLSAGRHDVVVEHPPKGLSKRFKVVVEANETVTRVITFD